MDFELDDFLSPEETELKQVVETSVKQNTEDNKGKEKDKKKENPYESEAVINILKEQEAEANELEKAILAQSKQDANAVFGSDGEVDEEQLDSDEQEDSNENEGESVGDEGEEEEVRTIDILKELGVFEIPDEDLKKGIEVDAAKIEEYKENTKNKMFKEMLEELKSSTDNPYLQKKMEFLLYGKTLDKDERDVSQYDSVLDTMEYYDRVDLTDLDNAKKLVIDAYAQDLDKNSALYQRQLKAITAEVNALSEDELTSEAASMKTHVLKRLNEQRLVLEQKERQKQELKATLELQKKKEAVQWHQSFKEKLKELSWDNTVKDKVLDTVYSTVKVGDKEMAKWLYLQKEIVKDPVFFAKYVEFLSSVDLEKREFTKSSKSDLTNQLSKKVEDLMNKKVKKVTSGKKLRTTKQEQIEFEL